MHDDHTFSSHTEPRPPGEESRLPAKKNDPLHPSHTEHDESPPAGVFYHYKIVVVPQNHSKNCSPLLRSEALFLVPGSCVLGRAQQVDLRVPFAFCDFPGQEHRYNQKQRHQQTARKDRQIARHQIKSRVRRLNRDRQLRGVGSRGVGA